ncbi:hypothetical protein ASE25_10060 [Terrabacter sp. Root85]|uniref:hypothetical protein n=1 Tax=unclassified Terrabacter TaxID=2630222 RepID=UPI0006F86D91|nr:MULTISPECIES: hypothetical protein [unclassified Terrabacter]KRC89867.1 hypothetical protein ASE25_10060 [Terrabacter sp. Root85]KRF39675.1 hypothetical protein ASH01_20295 [Terrabacter sp. Soil811]
MSDRDLDAEFARIIAGWDDEAPEPQRRDAPASTDQVAQPAAEQVADPAPPSVSPTEADTADAADQPGPTSAPDASPSPVERPQAGRGTDPAAPPQQPGAGASTPSGSSGLLELPIAPTTSHEWRGPTSRRDDADAASDGDDHFVPPSEIDLPSAETDPMFWAIVGGLAGGPLLLLYVLFFDRDGSGWWVVTALTMVVVGFVLLVLRGGTERDPFDDGTRL